MHPLDVIRKAPKRQLRDPEWLEQTILDLGLAQRFDASGEPPEPVGLAIWQSPKQLAPYLIALSAMKVTSYAEIGVFHGGTFALTIEYLSRFHPLSDAIAVDLDLRETLRKYAATRPDIKMTLIQSASTALDVKHTFDRVRPDLVLIDADHVEAACRADWELAREYARLVAFHDICEHSTPGVKRVWDSIEAEKKWSWTGQYNGGRPVYGLGLIDVRGA